jgi:hypothetical protein
VSSVQRAGLAGMVQQMGKLLLLGVLGAWMLVMLVLVLVMMLLDSCGGCKVWRQGGRVMMMVMRMMGRDLMGLRGEGRVDFGKMGLLSVTSSSGQGRWGWRCLRMMRVRCRCGRRCRGTRGLKKAMADRIGWQGGRWLVNAPMRLKQ